MTEIRIIGVGRNLPGEPIDNTTMEELFGIRNDWIDYMVGNRTRYMALDPQSKEVTHSLADLGEGAAREAVERSGLKLEDIDLIVMSSATPDQLMPATVNLVADRLGLNNILSLQIQCGCSGALQSIEVAATFLKAGRCRNALVIGAENCQKYIDFAQDYKKMPPEFLVNLALFGDAAGAVVLSSSDRAGLRIDHLHNSLTGKDREPGHIMHWNGLGQKVEGRMVQEFYKEIEAHVPGMAKGVFNLLKEQTNRSEADVAYFLTPQLGGHMTDKINTFLGVDLGKTINPVADIGNNGNALPYMQLYELWDRIESGQVAMQVAIESSKWLESGMVLVRD